MPISIFSMLITIIFPPIGVWLQQHQKSYPHPQKIIISFILTALFYFPGLIYALNENVCGGEDTYNTNISAHGYHVSELSE